MASDNNKKAAEPTHVEELNDRLTAVGQKMADNKKVIYWSVGIIIAAGCLFSGWYFLYKGPREAKGFDAYGNVELMSRDNDSIAAHAYKKVADAYSGTDAGNVAALSAAEHFYDMGNYNEAIKYLKKFDTDDEVLMANAQTMLGDCYVNTDKYDDALDAYEKAISTAEKNPQIVPRVLLKEANVYDAQKKYDKALKCYETIAQEYPRFIPGNGMTMEAYAEREKARMGK